MQHSAFKLLIVIIAFLAFDNNNNNHVSAVKLSEVHVEPSQRQLRTGDAYNVSCWFETLATLQELCGSIDNLYMQTNANANLTLRKMNATGVYHMVNSAQPMHKNSINGYECLCRGRSLKSARFMIGVRFLVTDFSCSFRDYVEQAALECSFTKPALSDNVDDKANFTLQHDSYTVDCNKHSENGQRMQCSIPSGKYDKFRGRLNFTLRMLDTLGAQEALNFSLTKEQCIILKQPGENHNMLNRTSDATCLIWDDRQLSNHIKYGIAWSVELLPHYNSTWDSWRVEQSPNQQIFCVDLLPYPHHNYTLILKRRYNSSDARWSEPFVFNFSTAAALPWRPPIVWPGGYQLDPVKPNDLIVYWQQLQQLEYNGPQFTYNVSIHHIYNSNNNNNSIPIKQANIKVESNRAIITNFNATNGSYKIIIHSQNAVGMSVNSSEIIAVLSPHKSYNQRIPKNLKISKTAATFSWEPPEQRYDLLGYTIYWCMSNITDRTSCNDTLAIQAEQISGANQCHFNSPQAALDSYEWAVSANYGSAGSGAMHWLEWYHGSGFDNATGGKNADLMHSLEGVLAIVAIGFCVYALIRKFRYMSDINVEMPEGIVKQQELQCMKKVDMDAMPLMGYGQTRCSSSVRHFIEIPLVLNGNFKPLDVDVSVSAATSTTAPLNKDDYVRMQSQQKPQNKSSDELPTAADINVKMSEGIVKQQELQCMKKVDNYAMPLMGYGQTRCSSSVPHFTEIPLVLNGNFKPLDVDVSVSASTSTTAPLNKDDYVRMQSQQKPQNKSSDELPTAADINVKMSEGIVKQQELQCMKKVDNYAMPLMGYGQTRCSSSVPHFTEIPLVLNGNFKPLDVDVSVSAATSTTAPHNNVDYVRMQSQQKPQNMSSDELPTAAAAAAAAAPASCYVSMLSSHANNRVSDYISLPATYR